jgi:hypothetical protein
MAKKYTRGYTLNLLEKQMAKKYTRVKFVRGWMGGRGGGGERERERERQKESGKGEGWEKKTYQLVCAYSTEVRELPGAGVGFRGGRENRARMKAGLKWNFIFLR